MQDCRNCTYRYIEYCIGSNSKKYTECIRLGRSCELAAWVQDLDKINKEIVKL